MCVNLCSVCLIMFFAAFGCNRLVVVGETVFSLDSLSPTRITTDTFVAFSGYWVAGVGDVNNDSIPDLLFSMFSPGDSITIVAALLYGKESFGSEVTLQFSSVSGTALTTTSDGNFAATMQVGAAGDFNKDGFDDFLVSTIMNEDDSTKGVTYLIYGNSTLPVPFILEAIGHGRGVKLEGRSVDFEHSVAPAGDVNNDGFPDIIIGGKSYDVGCAFLIYGGTEVPSTLSFDSLSTTHGISLCGDEPDLATGDAIAGGGDINNDGYDDLVIGEFLYANDSGRVFLFKGRSNFGNQTIDLVTESDVIFLAPKDSYCGYAVSFIGDVNNDEFDDFLIGCPRGNDETGVTYLIYGSDSLPPVIDLNSLGALGVTIFGNHDESGFGASVGPIGDLNQDGYDDFVVSEPGYDDDRGRIYIFYGSNSLPATLYIGLLGFLDLEVTIIEGEEEEDEFGNSFSFIGDIDRDGINDLLIGSPFHDYPTGSVAIVYGNSLVPAPTGEPSSAPSGSPSAEPSLEPTGSPSSSPSSWPTGSPSVLPTTAPTPSPTSPPSKNPTSAPSLVPSSNPTSGPSGKPSSSPTGSPSASPSGYPTTSPSLSQTSYPSSNPSSPPTGTPTATPSSPTFHPTLRPTATPTTVLYKNVQITLFLELLFFDTRMVPPQSYSNIIVEVLRNFTGLPEAAIAVDYPPGSIRSLSSTISLLVTPVLQAPPSLSVVYTARMRFNAIDYPHVEGNNSRLIMELERNLSRAIDEGEVRELLKVFGGRDGFTNYTSLLTGDYSFISLELNDSGEGGNRESTSQLSAASIAGITIAIVFSVIIVLVVMYMSFLRSRTSKRSKVYISRSDIENRGGVTLAKVSRPHLHI